MKKKSLIKLSFRKFVIKATMIFSLKPFQKRLAGKLSFRKVAVNLRRRIIKIGSLIMKLDFKDLALRFVFGGAAVAACYIVMQTIPSKSFAGVLAAFPAVMVAAVIMAGYFGTSEQASDIALGASAGMIGCAICVFTAAFSMEHINKWGLSIIIALLVWFFSSYYSTRLIQVFLGKMKEKRLQKTEY